MSNHLDKAIKKYMRATRRLLICPKNYRGQFLKDMERDMAQFIQENEPEGYSDIIRYFGTPAELAQTYLDNVSQDELAEYKIKRRTYIAKVGVTLVILSISIFLVLFISLWKSYKINPIYIEESIEISDENGE